MRQPQPSVSALRPVGAPPTERLRAQRGRGLPAVAGLVLLLALVTLAALWLLDPSPADTVADTAPLVGRDARGTPQIAAPAEGPSRSLPVEADDRGDGADGPLSAAERDELLAAYEHAPLSGRVVMADGSALPAGVAVQASRRQPHPRVTAFSFSSIRDLQAGAAFEDLDPGQLRRLTRTEVDAEGRFTIEAAPAASSFWVAVVSDEVYQPRMAPVSARSLDGELVLQVVRGATLEGRVLDPDNQGVAGLSLSGGASMDPWSMVAGGATLVELDSVDTDDDGRFRFAPVPVDVALVLASKRARGFQSSTVKIAPLLPGERRSVELRVHDGARLGGRVVDTDGLPVADTAVRLQPTSIDAGAMDVMGMVDFETDQRTDAEGRFRFDGLPEGGYQLVLTKGGFLPHLSGPHEVLVAAPIEDIELLADRGLSVSGTVVDPDGAPLAGVDVQGSLPPNLMSMRSRMDRPLRQTVTTDAQGRFRVTGFEQGQVRLVAEHADFSTRSQDVAAGAEDVRLTLQRKVAIRGIAIDLASGDPLERYSLRAGPAETLGFGDLMDMGDRMRSMPSILHVDDPDGRFELTGVEPGSYDLLVVAEGHARTVVEDVVVAPQEGASGVIVMVPEEGLLTGLVLSGRDGRPVADVRVTTGKTDAMGAVMSMLSGPALETTTDAEGRFELGGLGGAQTVTLSFQHARHRTLSLPDVLPMEGDALDLGVISLPPGATIWGHVTDDLGNPEAGVAVLVSDQRGSQMKRVQSDRDGRYEVNGLSAGTLNVMRLDMTFSLSSDNPMSALADMVFESVTVEDDELKRVDLSRRDDGGVVLKGRVRGAAGPEADATLVLIREDGPPATRFGSSDEDGRYSFGGVDPGDYVLQVIPSGSMAGGGSQPSSPVIDTLTVTDAAVQQHDVAVPGGALRGEVRAERDGQRLAGVRVLLERVDDERPQSPFLERLGYRVGEAYTDDQGLFTFRHLPRGRYDVVAGGTNMLGLGDSGWATQRVEDLEVREGSEGFTEVIELKPGCAIAGLLSDDDGKPLEGVPVWVRDEQSGRWISTLSELASDAGGRFEINSLDVGSYTVAVGGDAWAFALVTGVRTVRDETRDLELTLERGVEVRVDLNGHRRADLSVSLTDPLGRGVPTGLSSMNDILGGHREAGSLLVGRVEPGTYGVEVYESGELLEQKVLAVRLDEDPLVLTLPPVESDD